MKVRILVSIAGLDFSYAPGQIVDMPNEQAAAWIEGGNAEKVGRGGKPAPEAATITAAEKAVERKATGHEK